MKNQRSIGAVLLLSCVLALSVGPSPGCTSEDDVHQKQAEVQNIKVEAGKAETDWKAQAVAARKEAAEALLRSDQVAADAANQRALLADLRVEAFRDKIGDADTYLATLDAALKEPPPEVGGFLNTLIPFVPEPYRGMAATVSTIGLMAWRSRRLKKALESIPASLSQPNGDGKPIIEPEVFKAHKTAIDAKQTPLAKAAVDAAQGQGTFTATIFRMLPI